MSWEGDIHTRLSADGTLTAILTGGIYKAEAVGRDGITRDKAATAGAFDLDVTRKRLKPCAFIVEADRVYDGVIRDDMLQNASYSQRVRIFLYEDVGYSNIDSAEARIFTLLMGHQFTGALPLQLVGEARRRREPGALLGASMHIVDYLVIAVKGS